VIGDLIAKPLYNLGANLLAPLFDGGLRKAEVDRSSAVVDELAAAYGQVLLGAMLEVESALVLEKGQLDHIAALEHQVETNRATLAETRNRYREGVTDFLPVLSALQFLQLSEQNLLSARRQLLSYRIQLCRALGGTWTAQLEGKKS
jgi:outer membrane protein TolC